jgi:hypothetical protein
MKLTMPKSFTDHPLSKKAPPPLLLLVVFHFKYHMALDFVAILDFAGSRCDLDCVMAGWGTK